MRANQRIGNPRDGQPARSDGGIVNCLIPWHGNQAQLTIGRPMVSRHMSVFVDGTLIAKISKSTLQTPWVECSLPGSLPQVSVVQIQIQKYLTKTIVFVAGRSLEDGTTLDDWRSRAPVAIDGFEKALTVHFGEDGELYFLAWPERYLSSRNSVEHRMHCG